MHRRLLQTCHIALAALLVAGPILTQDITPKSTPPKSTPPIAVTRVLLPVQPDVDELRKTLTKIRERQLLELSFQDVSLGEIVNELRRQSGLQLSVSKHASQGKASLHVRGERLWLEVLDRLSEQIDGHTVMEPSGMVRILTGPEFARLRKASGGKLGAPAPRPDYYPQIEMRLLAHGDKGGIGVDLAAEKKRLMAWLDKGDNRKLVLRDPLHIARYHGLTTDEGGRLARDLRWFPNRITAGAAGRFLYTNSAYPPNQAATLALFTPGRHATGPRSKADYLVELLAVNMRDVGFTTRDLVPENSRKGKDGAGQVSLYYELTEAAGKAFAELTGRNIRRPMAVILDGYSVSTPTIMSRISRRGMLMGLSEISIDRIVKALDR